VRHSTLAFVVVDLYDTISSRMNAIYIYIYHLRIPLSEYELGFLSWTRDLGTAWLLVLELFWVVFMIAKSIEKWFLRVANKFLCFEVFAALDLRFSAPVHT
jgi:uncharacterized membrane protein